MFASRPGHWSESDFTQFLAISFPESSRYLVREAGSVLHRLVLRVGSYPYHQNPAKELDLGTLQTAIAILLRKDDPPLPSIEYVDEEEVKVAARLEARYSRLLFQSLAPTPSLDLNQKAENDDEDLLEALRVISKRRILRHPIHPKIGIPGPSLPSPSSFPSSYAQMLEGYVSKADLRNLIRLFLACQLYWDGNGPELVVGSSSGDLNKATVCVLRAFCFDQEGRCEWQSFDRVMSKQISGLQAAMQRILESFIKKPSTINEDSFPYLTQAEATELLHGECKSARSTFQFRSAVLTLPLLSQLIMFLPEDVPLHKAKLIFSTEKEQHTTKLIKTYLGSISHRSMLVLSGKFTCADPSFLEEQIICGVYLPSQNSIGFAETTRTTVFQCQPVNYKWTGKINRESSSLRGDFITDDLTFQVDDLEADVKLNVNSQRSEGVLTVWKDARSHACTSSHFIITCLEVFDIID